MIPRTQDRLGIHRAPGPVQEPSEPLSYVEIEVEDYTFTFTTGGAFTVTVFPEDTVEVCEDGFLISKPLETTRVYKRHMLMDTRMRRIQKIYEKPFMPSILGVGDQPAS